ncbi:uncharacterized protein LOC101860181 [Aplysia californica]|uniref:Uncharacterized protein LOC101860181 n=1 Tax=Aplysia californica TaxID=6500 RepID=A0ABM1VWD2_APLCA|nr:uncharacterized protein LOC101860181 [Aplysia californica]
MNVSADWDKDRCFRLLEEYENYTELWDTRNDLYYSKSRKNDCWEAISVTMNCHVDEAKRKMESLLASFRREKSKAKKIIALGLERGTHEVYESKWFAFDKMSFLMDRSRERDEVLVSTSSNFIISNARKPPKPKSTETLTFQEPQCEIVKQEIEIIEDDPPDLPPSDIEYNEEVSDEIEDEIPEMSPASPAPSISPPASISYNKPDAKTPTSSPIAKRRPIKRKANDRDIFSRLANQLRRSDGSNNSRCDEEDDNFDIFGKNVAAKLRSMSREQRIFAEKVINESLYYGELDCLTQLSRVDI